MIAPALVRVENVVAQAEPVVLRLPAELERVQRAGRARGEQVDGVAVALGLEELPHGSRAHELERLGLDFFDVVIQLQSLRIALRQKPFEVTLESEVPAV